MWSRPIKTFELVLRSEEGYTTITVSLHEEMTDEDILQNITWDLVDNVQV